MLLTHHPPQWQKLKILYQDNELTVIDKPAGMQVHPEFKGQREVTLLHLLRDSLQQKVYPFHRLDRPTSGAVIFLHNPDLIAPLQQTWHRDDHLKRYQALVRKSPPIEGSFNEPLSRENGDPQDALTLYKVLSYYDDSSHVEIELKTGRTHQIRRHFAKHFYHLIGDTKYGKGSINNLYREHFKLFRLFLHCTELSFQHPLKNTLIEVHSPLPPELEFVIAQKESSKKIMT
jgi:tRNA pseudouridine65 synthase